MVVSVVVVVVVAVVGVGLEAAAAGEEEQQIVRVRFPWFHLIDVHNNTAHENLLSHESRAQKSPIPQSTTQSFGVTKAATGAGAKSSNIKCKSPQIYGVPAFWASAGVPGPEFIFHASMYSN